MKYVARKIGEIIYYLEGVSKTQYLWTANKEVAMPMIDDVDAQNHIDEYMEYYPGAVKPYIV